MAEYGRRHEDERGAVVIEFALVFVMFFMVMYGIVAYGVIFAIKHTLTQAANEGARAAVKDVGGLPERIALAGTVAAESMAWLGERAPAPVVTAEPCAATPFVCVRVSLTYDYASSPLVPALPALGIALPASLVGQATVQLDAVY